MWFDSIPTLLLVSVVAAAAAAGLASGTAETASPIAPPDTAEVADATDPYRLHLPLAWQHQLGPSSWRAKAQIGGDVGVVTTDGRLAYVRVGTRLTTVDLSDPGHPFTVGESTFGAGMIHRAVQAGGHVYALASSEIDDGPFGGVGALGPDPDSGLRVYDVRDPANPHQVGWLATPEHAWDLALVGDHALVVDFEGMLHVVDVSSPAEPRGVASLRLPGGGYSVAVDGSHAYIVSQGLRVGGESHDRQLHVVDLQAPTQPRLVASLVLPASSSDPPTAVATGGHVFLSTGAIVDATDPSVPHVVAEAETACHDDCRAVAVAVEDTTLHIVNFDPGQGYPPVAKDTRLLVFDVSQPRQPVPLSTTHFHRRQALAFAFTPDHVLMTAANQLHVVDVRDPTAPSEIAQLGVSPFCSASAVAVEGERVYVVADESFTVWDASDPRRPHLLGAWPFTGTTMSTARKVVARGRYVFIQTRYGVYTVDVSTPSRPTLVSVVQSGDNRRLARDVAVSAGTAFLATWVDDASIGGPPAGVRVIDVGDPAVPVDVSLVHGNTNAAFVGDGALYRSAPCRPDDPGAEEIEHCFDIWDVTVRANPRRLGVLPLEEGQFDDGARVGDYVYVVSGGRSRYGPFAVAWDSARLRVVDVSDPADPVLIGTVPLSCCPGNTAPRMVVSNGRIWVSHAYGVEVFDITDPTNPARIAMYPLPHSPADVAVAGDSAYVAADGLWVIDAVVR